MRKVSIIMPVYNMERFIRYAIQSVINQTYPLYELVIVDDGSVDGSKQIVDDFILNYRGTVSIVYHNQQNQGLACARNTGINISTGEYIALLDPDDAWLPDRLRAGVEILDQKQEVGLVHANIIYIDEHDQQTGIPTRDASILAGDMYLTLLLRKGHISCPTVLFRRVCLDVVGAFDEHLTYLGCEDRDLWLRIARKYKTHYINKELAYYRRVTGSMSSNTEKMFKARTYVVNKNAKGFLRRQGHSATHTEMAEDHAFKKEYTRALTLYLTALFYWPFNSRAVSGVAKTALKMFIR